MNNDTKQKPIPLCNCKPLQKEHFKNKRVPVDYLIYMHPTIVGLDDVCAHCGHTVFWSRDGAIDERKIA